MDGITILKDKRLALVDLELWGTAFDEFLETLNAKDAYYKHKNEEKVNTYQLLEKAKENGILNEAEFNEYSKKL